MSVIPQDAQEIIPGADELLPEPRPGGVHRRREWVDIILGSLRFGRTKVGLAIVLAIVALAFIFALLLPEIRLRSTVRTQTRHSDGTTGGTTDGGGGEPGDPNSPGPSPAEAMLA